MKGALSMDMEPRYFKVATYLPQDKTEELIGALREITVNQIGNYSDCISYYPVQSTWTCLDGSTPYIGKPGEISRETEDKVEFLCHEDDLRRAISAIRRVHPYEQPVIDIIPMYIAEDFD